MTEPLVFVTDKPDDEARAAIGEGLAVYTREMAGARDGRALAAVVKDGGSGRAVGGILGRSTRGVMFLDLVFLPKALRGSGLGSRLLAMAEEEGRRRGCRSAVLWTLSFQAPDFYKRHGWRVFGEIPCEPPGTSRFFMTKDL